MEDGIGLSLYPATGPWDGFGWPATMNGLVALTAAQMGYLLEAIDGEIRNTRATAEGAG